MGWNSQGWVVVLAVPARSHPWEFPLCFSFTAQTPAASPPLAFAAAPAGQLKPSGALPVGGDFIAQQETPSRVLRTASPLRP